MKKIRPHSRKTLKFKVSIPYSSFLNIKPQEKYEKPKMVCVVSGNCNLDELTSFWIVFLNSIILYHTVTPLSLKTYISFKGICLELNCRTIIFGEIENAPMPEKDVLVNFIAVNTFDIEHTKKRFLRQPKRGIISKEVLNNRACQWRRNLADSTMDYGNVEPPNIYKGSVLRMAKQEHVNKILGIEIRDPIMSIVILEHGIEHKGSIHYIENNIILRICLSQQFAKKVVNHECRCNWIFGSTNFEDNKKNSIVAYIPIPNGR